MKFGARLPQYEHEIDPNRYQEYATLAEKGGYQHLLASDHVLGVSPERGSEYTSGQPFHEPLVLFGYLAATTVEINLVTGILILPQRQTALVAKQAAEVDVLSNGRLRLGVGVGWNDVEYTAMGQNFHTRGRRMEAQMDVIRRLWAEEAVTVEDQWHDIPDAGINPRPVDGNIPVWIGGAADPVLDRIARLADGWLIPPSASFDEIQEMIARLDSFLDEAGRDRSTLAIVGRLDVRHGDPDEWVEQAKQWNDVGATHITVQSFDAAPAPLERLKEFIDTMVDSDLTVEN